MAQTPAGTATPYCSVAILFQFHDFQQVADALRDGDQPRPTKLRLLDATSAEGLQLTKVLLAASGELEGACRVANRYSPLDLAALTGSGLARMQKIVADLAFWSIVQFRQPATADPKAVPGAWQALEELDRLRDGDRIFGFVESGNAGLPSVGQPDDSQRPNAVTVQAGRIFGGHGGTTLSRYRGG